MIVRSLSNLWLTLAGGLLLAACFAFAPGTLGWLALAAGCAVLVGLLGAFALRGRGWPQRALDLLAMALAGWTVVASRTFAGSTLRWLSVGESFALLGLGVLSTLLGQLQLRAAIERALRRPADGRGPALPPSSRRSSHRLVGRV